MSKDRIVEMGKVHLTQIRPGELCFGDGTSYALCKDCGEKLYNGDLIARHYFKDKTSKSAIVKYLEVRCSDCHNKLNELSVRTSEEQEDFIQSKEYIDLKEYTEKLDKEKAKPRRKKYDDIRSADEDVLREILRLRYQENLRYKEIRDLYNFNQWAVTSFCRGNIPELRHLYDEMV